LELANEQRSKLEGSNPLVSMSVKELNSHRLEFNNDDDMCHYYLGYIYLEPEMVDFSLAKKHIELALAISTWREYEKKYVYAVALEKIESSDVFMPVLEEFDRTGLALKQSDYRWFFIRYLLAFHEYHDRGNIQKARRLIEEGLAVDATNTNLLDLQKKINATSSILKRIIGFFE
jgi:tetratricopeptide (TPR) repeat protein